MTLKEARATGKRYHLKGQWYEPAHEDDCLRLTMKQMDSLEWDIEKTITVTESQYHDASERILRSLYFTDKQDYLDCQQAFLQLWKLLNREQNDPKRSS